MHSSLVASLIPSSMCRVGFLNAIFNVDTSMMAIDDGFVMPPGESMDWHWSFFDIDVQLGVGSNCNSDDLLEW